MVTREQIMVALLALIQTSGDFVTVSRRLRSPESITPAQSPALFLLEDSEQFIRKSQSVPAVRILKVNAVFYNNVGEDQNTIPSTAINNALDQLDGLFDPDDASSGTFTLGGLVKNCQLQGEVLKAPGDITGASTAIVPILIEIP